MFKKLRSNRDPRDTLFSELRKEFGGYADKFNQLSTDIAHRHPKFLFAAMVMLLIASVFLAVLLHKQPAPKVDAKVKPEKAVINDGFDQLLSAGAVLRQTIQLRRQVDSISAKKVLSKTDSQTLIRALDSLQHMQMTLPR